MSSHQQTNVRVRVTSINISINNGVAHGGTISHSHARHHLATIPEPLAITRGYSAAEQQEEQVVLNALHRNTRALTLNDGIVTRDFAQDDVRSEGADTLNTLNTARVGTIRTDSTTRNAVPATQTRRDTAQHTTHHPTRLTGTHRLSRPPGNHHSSRLTGTTRSSRPTGTHLSTLPEVHNTRHSPVTTKRHTAHHDFPTSSSSRKA
jgi:hypothetical protein